LIKYSVGSQTKKEIAKKRIHENNFWVLKKQDFDFLQEFLGLIRAYQGN